MLLSVAIPTRDRADLLERALGSVVAARGGGGRPGPGVAERVEIVVSDNASDGADESARAVADRLLAGWAGPGRYVRHRPPVGMVDNFNACVTASSGEYVLLLHDDDYLLPGGLDVIVRTLDAAPRRDVLLFGVAIVDMDGRVKRRQSFRADGYLPARAALRRVLTNSSFVRFPAIVVRRAAYEAVGPFDTTVGGPTDFDMWTRLFARYGVHRRSPTVAAYTVHPGAATTATFNEATVATLLGIFDRARHTGVLDDATLRRSEAAFLHQFILGGTYRSLRAGDRSAARRVMRLFDLPAVRAFGMSPRWLPVRVAFSTATAGAGRP